VLIHAGERRSRSLRRAIAKWKGGVRFRDGLSKNQDLLRKLGVDEPIDYTQQRFEEIARKIDIVLDTLGDENAGTLLVSLKKGGVLVSLVSRRRRRK